MLLHIDFTCSKNIIYKNEIVSKEKFNKMSCYFIIIRIATNLVNTRLYKL